MKKKRSKTVSTSRKNLYFIFSTLNTVIFGQVPPKPIQKHRFRSHWFVNGQIRIRVLNVRIRIGEKTRIHPDPDQEHCFQNHHLLWIFVQGPSLDPTRFPSALTPPTTAWCRGSTLTTCSSPASRTPSTNYKPAVALAPVNDLNAKKSVDI